MLVSSSTETVSSSIGEKRVALRGLDWSVYKQMQTLLNERTQAHLTYDRGTLEITMPSGLHEIFSHLSAR